MSAQLAQIFTQGMTLSGLQRLMLMLPLCLSIAVIYKTTRCQRMQEVPTAAAVLWGTIVIGMFAVGIGLWLLFQIAV